eukprot:TRINITY_DN5891_c0_g1_i2.p1 TRINITY_DN5891_c0_g1~~TRINITY_DN5891_c0_g1_i2.p1  ORF type:complete len:518 (-),score=150.36 TRINITY_DN5891_c0_g1_i2:801-2354(-)
MSVTFSVCKAAKSGADQSQSVFVVGQLEDLKQHAFCALAKASVAFTDHALMGLLNTSLASLSPSPLSGAHSSFLFAVAPGKYLRIHLMALPTDCSRHNAKHRPDVVYELAQKHAQPSFGADEGSSMVLFLSALNWNGSESVTGLVAGFCRAFPLFSKKTARPNEKTHRFSLVFFDCCALDEMNLAPYSPQDLESLANGVRQAAAMVDAPCNILHTTAFKDEALARASAVQCKLPGAAVTVEVIEGEELNERGYGGIYGVGKAASNPPALVILTYTPPEPQSTVAWCGKGIVYDTGGLSIKSKTGMPGMKRDMGGAAAIMNAFFCAAEMGAKKKIHALLCLAENAVGPLATRPDDIHVLYSGKSVEINNTDAEGRLVLGDGVAHASKHLQCDVILDMCTLTGAQGISTGKRHAAVVCNSDELEAEAVRAGKLCGDLLFPIPYCPEFFRDEFASAVADMKNSVRDRSNAQSSCAAQFIANHLCEFAGQWIHVDMAAPSHKGELATGYGVALLVQLFVFH